jgi:hypothetical protein
LPFQFEIYERLSDAIRGSPGLALTDLKLLATILGQMTAVEPDECHELTAPGPLEKGFVQ